MSTKKRRWTPEEDAELKQIAAYTLRHGRRRGRPGEPDTLVQFAQKHGRTLAAVKMRAKRKGFYSYDRWYWSRSTRKTYIHEAHAVETISSLSQNAPRVADED